MEPSTEVRRADLQALRRQRAELRDTIGAVENALAAPAAGRAVVWGEKVHQAVVALGVGFDEHIDVTEGPDGLHQSILAGDLRLANAVAALSEEHAPITTQIVGLIQLTQPPVTASDVEDIRERGTSLLGRLVRHRQRGADLIYEAFETDIGGGD